MLKLRPLVLLLCLTTPLGNVHHCEEGNLERLGRVDHGKDLSRRKVVPPLGGQSYLVRHVNLFFSSHDPLIDRTGTAQRSGAGSLGYQYTIICG